MHTKADVLIARLNEARKKVDELEREILGLRNQPCELSCGKCGAYHATEWDFASHYVVNDTRYLNLGWCPKDRDDAEIERLDRKAFGRG